MRKLLRISRSQRSINPFPKTLGGLGEALTGELKGLPKFRFDQDYRVVYKLVEVDKTMKIIIVGLRVDKTVYRNAQKRI